MNTPIVESVPHQTLTLEAQVVADRLSVDTEQETKLALRMHIQYKTCEATAIHEQAARASSRRHGEPTDAPGAEAQERSSIAIRPQTAP